MSRESLESKKAGWVKWLESYGSDKFLDSFLKSVEGAESRCVYCGEPIYVDVLVGGGVPDWSTADGDFGCHKRSGTCGEYTGSHSPKRRTPTREIPTMHNAIVKLAGDILMLAAQRPLSDGGADTTKESHSVRFWIEATLDQHLRYLKGIHGPAGLDDVWPSEVATLMWSLAWDEVGVQADRATRCWASSAVLGILMETSN